MRRSFPALFTALPAAALLLALAQAPARADSCIITGPAAWCGTGTVALCGPTGDWAYEWGGPNGFSSGDQCVNVSTPGHYTLVAYNPWTGAMMDPCSFDLAVAPPPVASIDGAASTCAGTSARLCGPFGNFSWLWTAPDGSQATTQCVDAGQAGTWTLAVTDLASGCSGDPATHALAFTVCDTTPAPPPTPPPGDPVVCPRNVNFWAQQCRGNGRHNGNMLDDDAFARLAACVDAHTTVFDWSNPVAGLCSTLNFRSTVDLRSRTLRQFAAVVANVCAGNLGLATSGAPLGLDPSTPLTMQGQASTVGGWMIDADARLTALEGQRGRNRDRNASASYRSILRSAWNINHGVGLGVKVCDAAMRSGGMGDDADGAGDDRDMTIGLGTAGPALSIASPAPNPFRAGTRVEFTVDADDDQNVVVTVHDLSGRIVRELARGSWSPGTHALDWNGTDASGHRVPAGIYFVRGSIGGQRVQSRVTMLR
jgi:hypothetical protein